MQEQALTELLQAAFAARQPLIARLHEEDTNAYRLFNGSSEKRPGLTVDRYGDLLLIQTFHNALDSAERAAIENFYAAVLPGLISVYNDRSRPNSRVANPLPADLLSAAQEPREIREMGVRYVMQARDQGLPGGERGLQKFGQCLVLHGVLPACWRRPPWTRAPGQPPGRILTECCGDRRRQRPPARQVAARRTSAPRWRSASAAPF